MFGAIKAGYKVSRPLLSVWELMFTPVIDVVPFTSEHSRGTPQCS